MLLNLSHLYPHQSLVVVGLGKTGQAVMQAFNNTSTTLYVYDDNAQTPSPLPKGCIWTQDLNTIPWPKIQALLLSPGIPHDYPQPHPAAVKAREHNIPIICDIDLLCQSCPQARYVAITGTNGKSTTTALIGHLLNTHGIKALVGGNIGVPALRLLEKYEDDATFVLELSSFQLERVPHLKADIAVWLNITPDHLDRYADLNAYIAAKKNIFQAPGIPQTIIMGIDDPISQQIFETLNQDTAKTVIPASVHRLLPKGLYVQDGQLYDTFFEEGQSVVTLSEHPFLKGDHNAQNMMLAYGATRALVHHFDLKALLTFQGLPHRQEFCGQKGLLRFINDSKATNIEATHHALRAYDHIYLILGGVPKETLLSGIESARDRIRHCFLIGQAQETFAQILDTLQMPYTKCHTLDKAVATAVSLAQTSADLDEKTILLSPACASYDQFKNFEHRGQVFKELDHQI